MYEVTLTFDNGPTPEVTHQVLDVLGQYGILATFFVVGQNLNDPDARAATERAKADGHWIGNHSWSHPARFGELNTEAQVESEIVRTQLLLGPLEHPDRLFRPPGDGGHLDHRLLSEAAVDCIQEQRLTCVLWNVVPRDWEAPKTWVERAVAMCRRLPRSLVVLHDTPTGAMDRLPDFFDVVAETGGRFRQDFPPDCVPIRNGRIVQPIEKYITEQISEAALQ